MGMQKIGDWEKVGLMIANLGAEMKKARELSLKAWGLKAESFALKHMRDQDLSWQPLNPHYLASKIRKGYSENILIATSDYFQAINSWVEDDTAYAGVKKTVTNSDGDVIADIAAVHEFGAGGIGARPLWQPVFKETMDWFMTSDKTPIRIFEKNIKKYL